jgi:hypothetical protein
MRNARAAVLAAVLVAQAPAAKSILGTVTSFNKEANTLEVKADNAPPVPVKLLSSTSVQRIAPGETSLAKATTITAADITTGDRVLVNFASNGSDALRVVVMAATDIAKRDDADRQDWAKRGISGIVAAKNGNQILLQKQRTPSGEIQPAITASNNTTFRRYSPDSVKFADAVTSKLDDVNVGDQIRARGTKSPDGMKVDAEEAIFGTFLTKAGSVVSIDTASREITVKELGTGKPLTIKLTADSNIKQMPNPPADARGGAPGAANIAQIVDRLPAGRIEDIKPGTSLVVSSTKGSAADKVTAILIVTNADALIRMASTPSGRAGTLVFGAGDAGGLSVLGLQ